jgi:hypothetical protein
MARHDVQSSIESATSPPARGRWCIAPNPPLSRGPVGLNLESVGGGTVSRVCDVRCATGVNNRQDVSHPFTVIIVPSEGTLAHRCTPQNL